MTKRRKTTPAKRAALVFGPLPGCTCNRHGHEVQACKVHGIPPRQEGEGMMRYLQRTRIPTPANQPVPPSLPVTDAEVNTKLRANEDKRKEHQRLAMVWAELQELCAYIPREMMLKADVTQPVGHMGYIARRYDRAIRAHEAREGGATYKQIGRELGVTDKRARQLAEIGRRRKPTRNAWEKVLEEYGTPQHAPLSQSQS